MATIGQLVTADDLLRMPQDERCELIAGEVVMMTPAGYQHNTTMGRITRLLLTHAEKEGLGDVAPGDLGFVISHDPDTVRCPDVAFVRRDRRPQSPEGFFPGAPDLAVEVVSPNDRVKEVNDKARAWLDAGTTLVWVVWPDTRSVTVHRPGQKPAILHEQDAITGEDALPGFQCTVAEFFGG